MDTELREYLGGMEQRIVTTVRQGDDTLRDEMRAGDEALRETLREEIRTVDEALRKENESLREEMQSGFQTLREADKTLEEKMETGFRDTKILFENMEANVHAVWKEGTAAITQIQNNRLEKQREHFDGRVSVLEAGAGHLSEQVRDHERRISTLEDK